MKLPRLLTVEHFDLRQPLHVDAALDVAVADLETRGARRQKVADLLVVDLQEGALDRVAARGAGGRALLPLADGRKQGFEDSRGEAAAGGQGGPGAAGLARRVLPQHGVGLPAAGLTVGEDGAVEAGHAVVHHGGAGGGKHVLLGGLLAQHSVERGDVWVWAPGLGQRQRPVVSEREAGAGGGALAVAEGPHADDDAHGVVAAEVGVGGRGVTARGGAAPAGVWGAGGAGRGRPRPRARAEAQGAQSGDGAGRLNEGWIGAEA